MMERHLIHEDLRYVIVHNDENNNVTYLRSLHFGSYDFVNDVSKATKTRTRKLANEIINNYGMDTGDISLELFTIPLVISYTLVEE